MRLEHPSTGRGPYTYMHYFREEGVPDRQPEVLNHGYGYKPSYGEEHPEHYKYGFVSVEQANSWWDEDARRSAAHSGYKLAVYEVPEQLVHEDEYQCVFEPKAAKLLAHIDPEAWLKGDLNMLLQAAKEQAQCAHSMAQSSPLARTSIIKARPRLSEITSGLWSDTLERSELFVMPLRGRFSASVPNLQQIPRRQDL